MNYLRLLPLCVVVLGPLPRIDSTSSAFAQGQTEIWTDKAEYAVGETITVTLKVSNPDATTYTWATECNSPTIDFDGLHVGYQICSTYTHQYVFPPGSWRSWTLSLDPEALGLPQTDGQHEVVVHFAHLSDAVQFTAPQFVGGRVEAHVFHSANPDSVAAARLDLQATVISSLDFTSFTYEVWEIVGTTIEDADARYNGPDVNVIALPRYLDHADVTSVDVERLAETPERWAFDVYPNPFAGVTRVSYDIPVPSPVRVSVFDLLGREVIQVEDGVLPAGPHEVMVDGTGLRSGVYVLRLEAGGLRQSRILVRVQ